MNSTGTFHFGENAARTLSGTSWAPANVPKAHPQRRKMSGSGGKKSYSQAAKCYQRHWALQHKERFENLFDLGFMSDFVLRLGQEKEEVKVHKIFLQTGSQVLCNRIDKDKTGEKGHLELPDVEPRFFKLLVKYLYTGNASGITMIEAFPLYKLATDFAVHELRKECNKLLSEGTVTDENALQVFQMAMEYGQGQLITKSLEHICSHGITMMDHDEFSALRLECLVEIIQQDKLLANDEFQVFDAVYKWGIAECKRKNLDVSDAITLQKVLNKPLQHVRFPLMDKEKFALHVATKNVLSIEESMALLMCFLVSDENRSLLPNGRFSSTPRQC